MMQGHTAVVTGATRGIGRAIACALAGGGAEVCLIGRDERRLEDVQQECHLVASSATSHPCDLSSVDEIRRLVAEIDDKPVDILIHAAGIFTQQRYEDATAEDLDHLHAINVRAPYLLTQALLPKLKERNGQVVFINSSAAEQKSKGHISAYTASKYALRAVADSVRDSVNEFGVRVMAVYPGRTATQMQEQIHALEDREYSPERLLQPEDIAQIVVDSLKLPRTAEVTDISIRPFMKG